jgi:hypothetical protein
MDQTAVANLALVHLGDRFIDSINNQRNPDANTLRLYYTHARNAIYEMHDWKWAKRSGQLQVLATAPTVRYDYAYALPAHFRRLSNISDSETMDPQLDDFDIVDRTVTTNSGYVFMEYVASDWDESVWPAPFADCVAIKLAALACMRITHDKSQKKLLEEELMKTTLPVARSVDSQNQPARKRFIRSEWGRIRMGRWGYSNLRRP